MYIYMRSILCKKYKDKIKILTQKVKRLEKQLNYKKNENPIYENINIKNQNPIYENLNKYNNIYEPMQIINTPQGHYGKVSKNANNRLYWYSNNSLVSSRNSGFSSNSNSNRNRNRNSNSNSNSNRNRNRNRSRNRNRNRNSNSNSNRNRNSNRRRISNRYGTPVSKIKKLKQN